MVELVKYLPQLPHFFPILAHLDLDLELVGSRRFSVETALTYQFADKEGQ